MSGVNAIWGSEQIRYLLQGGWFPKARIGKRRVVVPVLVSLGVKADGKRVVLDMRLAGEESAASWGEVVASLVRRNLGMPKLALIDAAAGPVPISC
jgi:transposase-like protein